MAEVQGVPDVTVTDVTATTYINTGRSFRQWGCAAHAATAKFTKYQNHFGDNGKGDPTKVFTPLTMDSTGAMTPSRFKVFFDVLKAVYVDAGRYWSSATLSYWRSRISLAFHRATAVGTRYRFHQFARESNLVQGFNANAVDLYAYDLLF